MSDHYIVHLKLIQCVGKVTSMKERRRKGVREGRREGGRKEGERTKEGNGEPLKVLRRGVKFISDKHCMQF